MAGFVIPGTAPAIQQREIAKQTALAEAERRRQTGSTTASTSDPRRGAGSTAATTTQQSGGPTSFQTDQFGNVVYQGTTGDPKTMAEAERLRLQAQLQADAEARRWAMFSSTPGGSAPTVQYGAGGDDAAARAAAFARAKDQSGQIARSSLDSLYGLMAATGRAGSPIEAGEASKVLQWTAGDLGNLTREQYIQDLLGGANRASEVYRGGIAQRGQDLAARQSLLGLITSRGLY